jgi:hypothetical protein
VAELGSVAAIDDYRVDRPGFDKIIKMIDVVTGRARLQPWLSMTWVSSCLSWATQAGRCGGKKNRTSRSGLRRGSAAGPFNVCQLVQNVQLGGTFEIAHGIPHVQAAHEDGV